jgi:hypothetical protein
VRKLVFLSLCGLVLNAIILAALYLPGWPHTQALIWLSFIVAFLSFGSSIYLVNDRQLGRLSLARLWGSLRTLPGLVQIGLVLLLLATTVHFMRGQVGTQTELGFNRVSAGTAVWLCAVGTALLYSVMLQQERGEPAAHRKPSRFVLALFVIIGLALFAVTFAFDRDSIFDEEATHERLATQFGDAVWFPHLVAANTYHSAFVVYLDTTDPSVQEAACTDLKPVAARLDRVPNLYYARDGRAKFARSC